MRKHGSYYRSLREDIENTFADGLANNLSEIGEDKVEAFTTSKVFDDIVEELEKLIKEHLE